MRHEGMIPESNIFVCQNRSCRQPIYVDGNLQLRKPTPKEAAAAQYQKGSTGRWVKRAKAPTQSAKFTRKPQSERLRRPDRSPGPSDEEMAAAIEAAKAGAEGEETLDTQEGGGDYNDFCKKQKVFVRNLIDRGVVVRWRRPDGKWVPRFKLIKEIGEGATAVVAMAIDVVENQEVVLKFAVASAYPDLEGEVSRLRIKRSYEIQRSVDSPHVLKPIALIAQDPDPANEANIGYVYVEPFINGLTIKQVIDRLKVAAEQMKVVLLLREREDQKAQQAYGLLQQSYPELVTDEWPHFRGDARVRIHTSEPEELVVPAAGLPEQVVITVMLQMISVLKKFRDGGGVVHRDIKPHNVIFMSQPCTFDEQGRPHTQTAVLIDFGEARRWSDPRDHRSLLPGETLSNEDAAKKVETLTQTGVINGTPHYMAPEQACGERLGWWTDMYSLCAMAYHMLAGRPMFSGNGALEIASQVLNKIPESVRKRAAEQGNPVSLAIAKIVHRGLEKRKDERFQSLEAMEEALIACRDTPTEQEPEPEESEEDSTSSGFGSVIRRFFGR